MVAIVAGASLGLGQTSAKILGGQGTFGNPSAGFLGSNFLVNASTGNLIIQNLDEILQGIGQDTVFTRTYNSLGAFDDDNGDNWRDSSQRAVGGLTGGYNAAGSTITRTDWDGSRQVFTWDAAKSAYIFKDPTGSFDRLTYSSASNQWTWIDGDSRVAEIYDNANGGRIVSSLDADGQGQTFTYTGTQLTQVTNSDGGYVALAWTGANLTKLTSYNADGTLLAGRVHYDYDSSGRLETVTVDMTPGDNSIADDNTVTYTYTYDGASKRVASIRETGSNAMVAFEYDAATQKITKVTETAASGDVRVTDLDYTVANRTRVTDGQGNVTDYFWDAGGRLTSTVYPTSQTVTYAWDPATGRIASVTDALGNKTSYSYDANGNQTRAVDAAGNQVDRVFDPATNALLTETRYLIPDPDGAGPGVASSPVTTRYVYDAQSHLRFVISPEGQVTEYRYDTSAGSTWKLTGTLRYTADAYDVSALATSASPPVSAMTAWVAGLLDKSTVERTNMTYDFRGNLSTVTEFSAANTAGSGLNLGATITTYVYDQFGLLLSRQVSGRTGAEVFTYDGLGRMTSSTDFANNTTTMAFDNANRRTVVTLANSQTVTTNFNAFGQALDRTTAGSGAADQIERYQYDNLGRLKATVDALLKKDYTFYDAAGRKTGYMDRLGNLTEYRYDAGNRLVATIEYATAIGATALASLFDANGNPGTVDFSSVRPAPSGNDLWTWNVYDAASRLTGTIAADGTVVQYVYDGNHQLVQTTSFVNRLSAAAISGYKTALPTALSTPAASANDRTTRYFYDKAGQKIGALDAAGGLTRSVYDQAGRLIETVQYATLTAQSLRAAGTWAQLLASVTATANPADRRQYFAYDGQGNLRFTLDGMRNPVEMVYNTAGDLIRTVAYGAPIGETVSYTLSYIQGQITSLGLATRSTVRTTRTVYDDAGRKAFVINAERFVTAYAYDSLSQVVKTTQYTLTFDTAGDQTLAAMQAWTTTHVHGGDRITRNVYDGMGRLAYVVDAEGYVTEYQYDQKNRLVKEIRYPAVYAVTDSVTRSSLAAQIGAVPATAITQLYEYDANGNRTKVTDGEGYATEYIYDRFGRNTDIVNLTTNSVTRIDYDAFDRIVQTTTAYGTDEARTVKSEYDGAGNRISTTDARSSKTVFTFDALGNTLTVSTPLYVNAETSSIVYATTTNQYDAFGNVTATTDARANTTVFTYDKLGNLVSQSVPLYVDAATSATVVATTTYQYDAFGNLVALTDPRLNTTYYYYDKLGRLRYQVDPEGYATATTYTIGSAVATVRRMATKPTGTGSTTTLPTFTTNNAIDGVTTFSRDKLDRLKRITDAESYYETYTLDAFGNRTHLQNKIGGVTIYEYDKRGLLTKETLPVTSLRSDGAAIKVVNKFEYDSDGNRTTMIEAFGLPEQRTTIYEYDKNSRLKSKTGDSLSVLNPDTMATSIVSVVEHYRYDANGNVIEVKDALGNRTLSYYDLGNRKIAEINPRGRLSTWTYDANGNIKSTRVYSELLASLPATLGGTPPTLAGNNYRETFYDYDLNNRLVKTAVGGVETVTYGSAGTSPMPIETTIAYDASGNVILQTDGRRGKTYIFYDKNGRNIGQIDAENYVTAYTLDHEGNVSSETRYSTRLGTSVSATTPFSNVISSQTTTWDDRTTLFTYDRNGRRLTERRLSVESYSVNATGSLEANYGTEFTITHTDLASKAAIVYRMYDMALGRAPTAAEVGLWSNYLNQHRDFAGTVQWGQNVSLPGVDMNVVEWFASAILGDGSVAARLSGTNSEFVTKMYQYSLHRAPNQSEVDYWVGQMTGGGWSRGAILAFFSEYHEHRAFTVAAISAGITEAASDSALIKYQYNGLGLVTSKTEATGDTTTYGYDGAGRQTSIIGQSFIDHNGATVSNQQAISYDGLNNVVRTVENATRTTSYSYGPGGRLISTTDPLGNTTRYFYDAAGRVTATTYRLVRADSPAQFVAQTLTYDEAGNQISQKTFSSTDNATWTRSGDTTEYFYNAYGEVIARGTNSNQQLARAQEFNEYDNAGRVWRTNFNDGVVKAYGYDANGNATLLMQSMGTVDLKAIGSLGEMIANTGISKTFSEYDARNQLKRTIQSTSNNAGLSPISANKVNIEGVTFYNANATVTNASNRIVEPNVVAAPASTGTTTVTSFTIPGGQPTIQFNNAPPDTAVIRIFGRAQGSSDPFTWLGTASQTGTGTFSYNASGLQEQNWDLRFYAFTSAGFVLDAKSMTYSRNASVKIAPTGGYATGGNVTMTFSGDYINLTGGYNTSITYVDLIMRPRGSNQPFTFQGSGSYSSWSVVTEIGSWSGAQGGISLAGYDFSAPNGTTEFEFELIFRNGNAGNAEVARSSGVITGNPVSQAAVTNVAPMGVNGPGQVMATWDGPHYTLLFGGLPNDTQNLRVYYRLAGTNNAFSQLPVNLNPRGGAYGQAGWWSGRPPADGQNYEFWVEPLDSVGNVIGDRRSYGTFIGGNGNPPANLTQYRRIPSTISFQPAPGANVTMQRMRYSADGGTTWSGWVTKNGGGIWDYDATGIAPNFYSAYSFKIEYETFDGATRLSSASGNVVLGYAGQSLPPLTPTSVEPAQVVFNPLQSSGSTLKLYYRQQGSSNGFTQITLTRQNGANKYIWNVDDLLPSSGQLKFDYYYDVHDSSGNIMPNLTYSDHVEGVVALATDHYIKDSTYEVRWQLNTASASQFLIDREQDHNAFGEIQSETDGRGNTTTLFYNTAGELVRKVSPKVKITDETGVETEVRPTEYYFYDQSGRQVAKRDANGNQTTRKLLASTGYGDAQALVVEEYTPGAHTSYGYDVWGDERTLTRWNGSAGITTRKYYDANHNLIQVDHALRANSGIQLTDHYEYDALGQRIKHWNSQLGSGVYEATDYDVMGRVTRTTTMEGQYVNYIYTFQSSGTPTAGLGDFGGWVKQTLNSSLRQSEEFIDLFGRTNYQDSLFLNQNDPDKTRTIFTYDRAGNLVRQENSKGQNVSFAYYENGYVKSVTDHALGMLSTFEYDDDGNRTRETYSTTSSTPIYYQNAVITYDALNRIVRFLDQKADISYRYDAVGNRRNVRSIYHDGLDGSLKEQDLWYKYDGQNRFVTTMGRLVGNSIELGTQGVAITYDALGNRASAIYGHDGHMETYTYSSDGYLEDTRIDNVLRSRRTNDAMGRVTNYKEYGTNGSTITLDRTSTYDNDNRVVSETTATDGSTTSQTFDYKALNGTAYTGADQGVLIHSRSQVVGQSGFVDTNYTYVWMDEAKQATVRSVGNNPSNPNAEHWIPGVSDLEYDVNGHIVKMTDRLADGGMKTVNFKNDAYGQVLVRDTWQNGALSSRQLHYYFDGRRIGDVSKGDESPSQVDYAQQLAQRGTDRVYGTYRHGQPISSADFDQNYQPINAAYPASAATSYTVRAGDTLRSIAQSVWGDADMWYLIAESNGLSASSQLSAGQRLTIPNKVTNFHNNTGTFRVYDPGKAIGDTLPTLPNEPAPPPARAAGRKGGCGVFGAILLAVVAIAVVAVVGPPAIAGAKGLLAGSAAAGAAAGAGSAVAIGGTILGGAAAGALSSVVSQGVGVATGLQDKFSWSAVGLAAIAAGVGGGLGATNGFSSTVVGVALRGAVGSVVSQGLGVATGLQDRFSWGSVASAGVGAGIGASINIGGAGGHVIRGMAGGLAASAAESLVTGRDFGDTLIANLPNIIANTIGNLVANGVAKRGTPNDGHMMGADWVEEDGILTNQGAIRRASQNITDTLSPYGGLLLSDQDAQSREAAARVIISRERDKSNLPVGAGTEVSPAMVASFYDNVTYPGGSLSGQTRDDVPVAAYYAQALDYDRRSGTIGVPQLTINADGSKTPAWVSNYELTRQLQQRHSEFNWSIGGFAGATAGGGLLAAGGLAVLPSVLSSGQGFIYANALRISTVGGLGTDMLAGVQVGTYLPAGAGVATASLAAAGSSVWKLGPGPRGEALEQMLGHNLPGNFPTIDRFENGIATSIKSIDLDAASYLSSNGLRNTLTRYVDKVAGFNGALWSKFRILPNQITGRSLEIVVPHSGTAAQQATIANAVEYGAAQNVTVKVIMVP